MMGTTCLAILLVIGAASALFTHGMRRKAYAFPWTPSRRSAFDAVSLQCSMTGEPCDAATDCCNGSEVCLRNLGGEKRTGTCQDQLEMKFGGNFRRNLLPSGESCETSSQCADGCCREIRGHRIREKMCGTPATEYHAFNCL